MTARGGVESGAELSAGLLHDALLDARSVESWSLTQWDLCIRQAARCALTARLHAALAGGQVLATVPAAARRHLEAACVLVDKHRRDIRYEIDCIEDALRPLDIPVLLLKGAAYVAAELPLAQTRLFNDVDIMVPRERLDDVEQALRREGWAIATGDAYDQRYYRRFAHELPPFVHAFRGTVLDVHHNILPPTATPTPDARELLASSRRFRGRLRFLEPADMFLHSATHLFHEGDFDHGFRDLLDLRDLLEQFADDEAFASRLQRRARAFGLERVVHHALHAVQRFWGGRSMLRELESTTAPFERQVMDALFDRALAPMHPSCDDSFSATARFALYVRGHWLRMPPRLLFPHLARKALKRLHPQTASGGAPSGQRDRGEIDVR